MAPSRGESSIFTDVLEALQLVSIYAFGEIHSDLKLARLIGSGFPLNLAAECYSMDMCPIWGTYHSSSMLRCELFDIPQLCYLSGFCCMPRYIILCATHL